MSQLSGDPRNDLQHLLNQMIDAASYLLNKNQEFYPFGASLDSKGAITLHDGDVEDDKPQSQDVIDSLLVKLGRTEGIRAAAIAIMATELSGDSKDIIRIDLHHVNGGTLQVLIPYSFTGLKKKVNLGEPLFTEGDKRIIDSYR